MRQLLLIAVAATACKLVDPPVEPARATIDVVTALPPARAFPRLVAAFAAEEILPSSSDAAGGVYVSAPKQYDNTWPVQPLEVIYRAVVLPIGTDSSKITLAADGRAMSSIRQIDTRVVPLTTMHGRDYPKSGAGRAWLRLERIADSLRVAGSR